LIKPDFIRVPLPAARINADVTSIYALLSEVYFRFIAADTCTVKPLSA